MVIRKAGALMIVATALMGSLNANANNNNKSKVVTTEATGSYNFRCTGPTLDYRAGFVQPANLPGCLNLNRYGHRQGSNFVLDD